MYILLGILLAVVGVVMMAAPRFVYEITQSWKNDGGAEPSDMYIWHTRLGGIVFFIGGIVGTVILIFHM